MEPKGSTGLLARMTLSDSFRLLITLNFYLLFVNYGYRAYLQGLKWTVGKDDIRKAVEFLSPSIGWVAVIIMVHPVFLEVTPVYHSRPPILRSLTPIPSASPHSFFLRVS